MRILLVNKFLHPRGGAERAVLELGAALAARGHEISWFGMAHPGNAVQGPDVGLVRGRDYHAGGWRRFRDAAALLYSLEARRAFGALLARVRPDVVHVHNIYHQLTPSILDAARARSVPVLMTVHDYKLVCPRYDMLRHGVPCDACVDEGPLACVRYRCGGSWAASALLATETLLHRWRDSYACIRLFFVPSRFMASMLRRAGIAEPRLRHLPHGVTARPTRLAAPAPERFVYAGRLSAEKGVRTLLEAVLRLERGTLVVCGTGPLEPELRVRAATARGRVELRGHLPAAMLWEEMQRASFTVLPSECLENAPFAVLESMALGRTVIASRVGGVPELVHPGATGILVPPGDVEAWRTALAAALDDPQRMRALGAGAQRFVDLHHTATAHVDAIERAYAEVCA